MYNMLHTLLSDKKGGEIFTLFSPWHFAYIFLAAGMVIVLLFVLRDKREQTRQTACRRLIRLAFGLYIADFFLMPLAYGAIDIEKLPFHACTAMCVMCFLSYRVRFLKKYRGSFVLLGFLTNCIYLIYPAGVMWHAVHPLSYRVVQTLLFHCVMAVYGAITLVYEYEGMNKKRCCRDLLVIVCVTAWALLGNYAYNGTSEGYSHFFNWFFVVRDPFYAIEETVAPFVMPVLNIVLFFAAQLLLHGGILCVQRIKARRSIRKN